jgi:hypothetical protein
MALGWRHFVFYRVTRDLHLYFGLFISPFILAFSVSVFFLNHAKVNTGTPTSTTTVGPVRVPPGIDGARGPEALILAKDILAQVEVEGEIGSTRFLRPTRHFVMAVSKPGLESTVDLDMATGMVTISDRKTGVLEALAYLHKMPGPHNVGIRGNWVWTQVWRWFADATIYLTLFISVTGLYLWFVLKTERRVGLALLAAGAVSFFGLVYAVIR